MTLAMRPLIIALILFTTLVSLPTIPPQKKLSAGLPESTLAPANQRIKKVLFDSDRLWMLFLDGTLVTLDLKRGATEVVAPDKFVFDIYRSSAKQVYLLGGASPDSRLMRVWQKSAPSWSAVSEIQRDKHDAVLGLKEFRDGLLVLTQHKIYLQEDATKWRTVLIKTRLGGSDQIALAATDNGYVYIGLNHGEFGGALLQVSIDSGTVRSLVKRGKPDSCEGPLNPECDPVTGVIRDPADSSCVIASIGLRHFSESGRLIRVCNESVSVVFSKSYREIASEPQSTDDKFVDDSTEAIFDLVPGEKDYWAVTGRGVYHFAPGAEPTFHAMPKLRNISGFNLSDDISNVIVVSTDINWAKSLSGYTPLIAVKD